MSDKSKIIFLWIATAVIVVAYLFWLPIFELSGGDMIDYNLTGNTSTGVELFFPLQALFMLLLCWYIHYEKHFTISFILLWLCVGNFIDELLFDNTTTTINEIRFGIGVFISGGIYKLKKRADKKEISLLAYMKLLHLKLRENRK